MAPAQTLDLIARLSACSLAVQTAELWQVRTAFSERGIYRQAELRRELVSLPRPLRPWLDQLLAYPIFEKLLVLQAILCLATVVLGCTPLLLLQFLLALLVCLRLRGSYNGGSDSMTLLSTLALAIAGCVSSSAVRRGCIYYVAVQTCLSYFLAGIVKLKEPSWRDGRALISFVSLRRYAAPEAAQQLLKRPLVAGPMSAMLMAFECTFPFALFRSEWAAIYLVLGLAFHAANAWLLGLNRFLLAWAASYPAIWYVAQ